MCAIIKIKGGKTKTSGSDVPFIGQCSCGSRCFVRTTPMRGVWTEFVTFDADGSHASESSTDDLRSVKTPKTMRCDTCGKRHRNPEVSEVSE